MTYEEFKAYVREWNRKADQAEEDGYRVSLGMVYGERDPFKVSDPICKVEDYGRGINEAR